MVENTEQAVNAKTTPAVHVAGSAASHKDVNAFILGPHGRDPRLTDIRHQGTDGTRGFVVIGGIHPCFGEAVTAMVVLTDEASHRPNEGQFVFVSQSIDMGNSVIDIA